MSDQGTSASLVVTDLHAVDDRLCDEQAFAAFLVQGGRLAAEGTAILATAQREGRLLTDDEFARAQAIVDEWEALHAAARSTALERPASAAVN